MSFHNTAGPFLDLIGSELDLHSGRQAPACPNGLSQGGHRPSRGATGAGSRRCPRLRDVAGPQAAGRHLARQLRVWEAGER